MGCNNTPQPNLELFDGTVSLWVPEQVLEDTSMINQMVEGLVMKMALLTDSAQENTVIIQLDSDAEGEDLNTFYERAELSAKGDESYYSYGYDTIGQHPLFYYELSDTLGSGRTVTYNVTYFIKVDNQIYSIIVLSTSRGRDEVKAESEKIIESLQIKAP